MNQTIHKLVEPFPHLIVENMYDEEELKSIWEELNFLTKPHKFLQNDLGTSRNSEGIPESQSKSIVLDDIYVERSVSNILQINRKLFTREYIHIFSEITPTCKSILHQNFDLTKIRYYENDDEYLPHIDVYNYTSITFFHKKPKLFEGGDLFFPEYNYTFECNNNHMILFPSCILHAATKTIMNDNTYCSGNGRYSMMQFMKLI